MAEAVALVPGLYRAVPERSAVRMTVGGLAGRIAAELPVTEGVFAVGKDGRMSAARTVLDARALKAGKMVANALKGRSGLDVARFATVMFASTAISGDAAGLVVEGMLTVRGVTHPARFEGVIEKGSGRRIVLRLEGTVDRTRYGLTVGRPLYAREATVRIRAVALRDR